MKLVLAIATAGLLTTGCFDQTKNDSKKFQKEGSQAYGQRQFETAIERFKKATDKWPENHVAWYMMAGSQIGKKDWSAASDAMAKAVQIAPEQAMYNMVYGYTLYEKAIQQAREDQARRVEKKPEEITPDLTSVNFEKSLQHLQEAVKLNNELWRAHYYVGRIHRDTGKSKEAAEEFTKALQAGPFEVAPWVALTELYRAWDYTKEAIAVAEQGVAVVPEGIENVTQLYYVLGSAYDDMRMDDKAIDAFTKAIDLGRDNHAAKYKRGEVYFRKGELANAEKDLTEFGKSSGKSLDFAKQVSQKMLMDIQNKKSGGAGGGAEKLSPEDVVKKGKG